MAERTSVPRGDIEVPTPNPSTITADAIDRAVANSESRSTIRIDAMEKAIELFHADLTRVPTSVDRQIQGLRELLEMRLMCMENDIKGVHAYLDTRGADIKEQITHLRDLAFGKIDELAAVTLEKFVGVNSQFTERDTRTDQRAGDTKFAVDAAFAAAKEATAKIEAGFTKQIDSQQGMIDTKANNAEDKIADLKDRITSMESRSNGASAGIGMIGSIILGVFSFIGAVGAIIAIVIAVKT